MVGQLAIPGRGSEEDKPPHQVGMTEDEALCDVAADGKPEHVHGLQAQSADKTRYVIGRRVDRVRGLAARTHDPCFVEQDHGTPARKTIGHGRIPIVQTGAEMRKKDERGALLRSEAPVCIAHPVRFDEAGRRRQVRIVRQISLALPDWGPQTNIAVPTFPATRFANSAENWMTAPNARASNHTPSHSPPPSRLPILIP